MSCAAVNLAIPASPPESGIFEVLNGGQTVIDTGIDSSQGKVNNGKSLAYLPSFDNR